MTKTKRVRPLVPNSRVETLCTAMFRAGVTETSYPQHSGMTGAELAELAQLEKSATIKSAASMVNSGRLVITTPHRQNHRRYVLSAAQVAQCAEVLRVQPEQAVSAEQPVQTISQFIQREILKVLHAGVQLTSGQIRSMLRDHGFRSNAVYSQLWYMYLARMIHRSGLAGSYVYSLPTQPAEHTEPAETAEPSNSDHADSSIVQATINAFHQAGEPLSDEQIEALHHMHPKRHRVLCDRVAAKAKAKARQEREAREARETALFEEYLQAAVEAEQMELIDT